MKGLNFAQSNIIALSINDYMYKQDTEYFSWLSKLKAAQLRNDIVGILKSAKLPKPNINEKESTSTQ